MASSVDIDIPQWKKDLILRRRNQSKCLTGGKHQQLLLCTDPVLRTSSAAFGRTGQQPSLTFSVAVAASSVASANRDSFIVQKCNTNFTTCSSTGSKMVQKRVCVVSNGDLKNSDSDSSEELHYGPGIVNKLKNKYLSLALRESNVKRPSILQMRKATSLENLLDDEIPNGNNTKINRFESRLHGSIDTAKNVPNRYRNVTRGSDMKRAHSVETISRADNHVNLLINNEGRSQHGDMFFGDLEGNDKPNRNVDNKISDTNAEHKYYKNNTGHRINRPKRVPLIMNEREKPPADVVKQTKRIFETRAEQRIKHIHTTGEVAEKVAAFNKTIKTNKKPPIKQKPTVMPFSNDKSKKNVPNTLIKPPNNKSWSDTRKENCTQHNKDLPKNFKSPSPDLTSLPSPIPDVFRINELNKSESDQNSCSVTSLSSHTPDLIIHSSPIHTVTSPSYKINTLETFIKEEIKYSNSTMCFNNKDHIKCLKSNSHKITIPPIPKEETDGLKILTDNKNKFGNSIVYDFSSSSMTRVIPTQPLKLEINLVSHQESKTIIASPQLLQQAPINYDLLGNSIGIDFPSKPINSSKANLSVTEIEKNAKNNTNNVLEQPIAETKVRVKSVEVKNQVPKKKPPRAPVQTTTVFDFTDRKHVPDYVGNDGQVRPHKIERPKVGDGGIILLPGVSLDESFTDDDEEWRHSLESPPSPCDVTFINDNILIDGRSSLSQKVKKPKMRISFIESGPEVYEYPSETSILFEDVSTSASNATVGHTVPSLSGSSSLANYTPKGASEDFQLGVTKSIPKLVPLESNKDENLLLQEVEAPILFSAGTNSDILF